MAELLIKQEDGTYIKVPIKVEIKGTGIVTNPENGEEGNGESL
jgi:hypothetical protein